MDRKNKDIENINEQNGWKEGEKERDNEIKSKRAGVKIIELEKVRLKR